MSRKAQPGCVNEARVLLKLSGRPYELGELHVEWRGV